jgi:PilZ domain
MNATYGQIVSLADVIEVRVAVTNRRSEVRRRPDEVRWLRGARLKYGPDVEIVDISPNGILIRSQREFSANDTVVLELGTTTSKVLVIARVLRSRKVAASPSAWFETAFRFKRPLEIEKHSSPADL